MAVRPKRGEVWIVDLGLAAKRRPGVVISVELNDEDRVLATIVPVTGQIWNTRFEADATAKFLRGTGVFNAQGIQSIPCAKFERRLGKLDAERFRDLESAVIRWLGFEDPTSDPPEG